MRYAALFVAVGAALTLVLSCSSDSESGSKASGGQGGSGNASSGGSGANGGSPSDSSTSSDSPVFDSAPPPPTTCERPASPAPDPSPKVVGDGTSASCTNAALQAAVAGGGTVQFSCGKEPMSIAISTTIAIEADTFLDGGGLVTLDGGGLVPIIRSNNGLVLTIKGIAFRKGHNSEVGSDPTGGGAIVSGWSSKLRVFDCSFQDNTAEGSGGAIFQASNGDVQIVGSSFTTNNAALGGAVYNLLSGLTIVDSTFVSNTGSKEGGGAVYTDGASAETNDSIGGVIRLCGCRFENNTASPRGGGAYLFAYPPDQVSVDQCAFSGNSASLGEGSFCGAGALEVGNASFDLTRSTFDGNSTEGQGGAVFLGGPEPSRIENCTFHDNHAADWGGAISGTKLALRNVTLMANQADKGNGAIIAWDGVTLDNTIFANHGDSACSDTFVGTHNLQWDPNNNGGTECTPGITRADPLLGTLGDNGGPTLTIPIAAGSAALGQGQACPAEDQRGTPRPADCDLGAYELP